MNEQDINDAFFEIERLKLKLDELETNKINIYKAQLNTELQILALEEYLEDVDEQDLPKFDYKNIYITDHALVRYMERNKGIRFNEVRQEIRNLFKFSKRPDNYLEVNYGNGYFVFRYGTVITYIVSKFIDK